LKRLFLAVLFIILMVSAANSQGTLGLEEKCSAAAESSFLSIHPTNIENDEEFGQCLWYYECHCNRKLDKCFILTHGGCFKKDESYNIAYMVDVFGEKEYASYSCKYDKNGVLEWRWCHLGDTRFNVLKGFEFNEQTKEWDIASEAYKKSLENPFSDPMKEDFDKWVKPFMEE